MAQTLSTHTTQSTREIARDRNIQTIVDFYLSGCTAQQGRIGIELEHFIVHNKDNMPVRYSEDHGIAWMLGQLKQSYPHPSYSADGHLIGLLATEDGIAESVSLEPAAQVEFSAGPFSSLAQAAHIYKEFETKIEALCAEIDAHVARVGYQPHAHAAETELIPKTRYKFMDRYLNHASVWGRRMMRGTTSTQVSIDYADEADLLHKMRLANAMVPLLSLITDNSPIFEGHKSPHRMMRTEIWEKLDPGRSGIAPDVMNPAYTLSDMAQHVLDTPAIVVYGKDKETYSTHTFGEVYAHHPMTREDAFQAVSMLFNDVRLKNYLEIRPADAMPLPYVIAYAALIKGMFANARTLAHLDRVFSHVTNADITKAKHTLERDGYAGKIYGDTPASKIADEMMAIANEGLNDAEKPYLAPLATLEKNRVTLADLWLQHHHI